MLEATRRVVGWIIPGIAVLFILYAHFGLYFGPLSHRPYSWARIASQLYLTTEGIFGMALGVSASFILLFVLFGAVIKEFGGSEFFINVSSLIGKRRRSGPALTTVISGALFGTISGSAVANVSTVGSINMPLLKRIGFPATFSGAILALSGTGGQLAPPVMGAAAFMMAELVGVPYMTIVKRSFIPAALWYISLVFIVDLYVEHHQLEFMSIKVPSLKEFLNSSYTFIIPVVALFYLLINQYSPAKSVTAAIILIILIATFIKKYRDKGIVASIFKSFKNGARGTLTVALTCACAGIIIGITNLI